MINAILADDHSIVSDAITKLLENLEWLKIIKQCSSGSEVIEFTKANKEIDVLITDLNMPEMSGLELITHLKMTNPNIKTIVLSMHDDVKRITACLNEGASGYLLKNADTEELVFAIKRIYDGHTYISAELVEKIFKMTLNDTSANSLFLQSDDFSSRELEILLLIADGLTNIDIAEKLFLSKRTVEGHRQSLLQKTNSTNTATLIRYAAKAQLLT